MTAYPGPKLESSRWIKAPPPTTHHPPPRSAQFFVGRIRCVGGWKRKNDAVLIELVDTPWVPGIGTWRGHRVGGLFAEARLGWPNRTPSEHPNLH